MERCTVLYIVLWIGGSFILSMKEVREGEEMCELSVVEGKAAFYDSEIPQQLYID